MVFVCFGYGVELECVVLVYVVIVGMYVWLVGFDFDDKFGCICFVVVDIDVVF